MAGFLTTRLKYLSQTETADRLCHMKTFGLLIGQKKNTLYSVLEMLVTVNACACSCGDVSYVMFEHSVNFSEHLPSKAKKSVYALLYSVRYSYRQRCEKFHTVFIV